MSRASKLLSRLEEEMPRDQALKILGLSDHDADDPEKVKAAHRKAALANHPDRGGSEEKMKLANAARDTLMADSEPAYRSDRHNPPTRAAGPTTPKEAAEQVLRDWEGGDEESDLDDYAIRSMRSWSKTAWKDSEKEEFLKFIADDIGGSDPFGKVKAAQSPYCSYLSDYAWNLFTSSQPAWGGTKDPAKQKAQKIKSDAAYAELERARIEMILHGKNDPAKKAQV